MSRASVRTTKANQTKIIRIGDNGLSNVLLVGCHGLGMVFPSLHLLTSTMAGWRGELETQKVKIMVEDKSNLLGTLMR